MPFIAKVEELLIAMLGLESAETQLFATIMLNCLYEIQYSSVFFLLIFRYDGHFWQQDTPFPVTISEVGKNMMISLPDEFNANASDSLMLYLASPFPCPHTAIDVLSPRMITCHSICLDR